VGVALVVGTFHPGPLIRHTHLSRSSSPGHFSAIFVRRLIKGLDRDVTLIIFLKIPGCDFIWGPSPGVQCDGKSLFSLNNFLNVLQR